MSVFRAEVAILAVAVLVVAVLLYDDGGNSKAFYKTDGVAKMQASIDHENFTRTTEHFEVKGTTLEAWLYLPKNAYKPPVVILAHGLGSQKEHKLADYAEIFVKRGIAVFVFDYRHYGGSNGDPRHTTIISQRIEDWNGAINHVGKLSEVNSRKIALWGTSLSGGHVVSVAASHGARKNSNITAIVAQVPLADGLEHFYEALTLRGARLTALALKDLVLSFFGYSHYIKIHASSEDEGLALLLLDKEEEKRWQALTGGSSHGWENRVPARVGIDCLLYRPINQADQVKVPALVILAEKDTECSPSSVQALAGKIPQATIVRRDTTHLGIYQGKEFEEVSQITADFLVKHLL